MLECEQMRSLQTRSSRLKLKTLKHKTADQGLADRRFALFTINVVRCDKQVQDRNYNHDALIGRHDASPLFCNEAGGTTGSARLPTTEL